MAVTIGEFYRRLDGLKGFILREIGEIMERNASVTEEMQRKRLSEGKNIREKIIQKGYSPGYAKQRKRRGLQTNYVDLNFTGEFYKSLELVPEADFGSFDIISDVDYAPHIFNRYAEIMGLNKGQIKELKSIVLKELKPAIRKYLVG